MMMEKLLSNQQEPYSAPEFYILRSAKVVEYVRPARREEVDGSRWDISYTTAWAHITRSQQGLFSKSSYFFAALFASKGNEQFGSDLSKKTFVRR
jgi:hypothetical protein